VRLIGIFRFSQFNVYRSLLPIGLWPAAPGTTVAMLFSESLTVLRSRALLHFSGETSSM
jgi:hypothetical protein